MYLCVDVADIQTSWHRDPLARQPIARSKPRKLKRALWAAARTFLCCESLSSKQSWCCCDPATPQCWPLAHGLRGGAHSDDTGSCFPPPEHSEGVRKLSRVLLWGTQDGSWWHSWSQLNSGLCSKGSIQIVSEIPATVSDVGSAPCRLQVSASDADSAPQFPPLWNGDSIS